MYIIMYYGVNITNLNAWWIPLMMIFFPKENSKTVLDPQSLLLGIIATYYAVFFALFIIQVKTDLNE